MLHLIYDLWHRHLVFTPAHGIYTSTCHAIFDTWYPTPVLAMLHLSLDIRHRYLICHTWHLLLTPGICMLSCGTNTWIWHLDSWPDTTTQIPVYYMTYSWLSLLRGLGMIIILLPNIWYSWTPVLLNSLNPWNRKAPDITPDIILLFRNRITMDIGLLWIPREHYYLRLCYI